MITLDQIYTRFHIPTVDVIDALMIGASNISDLQVYFTKEKAQNLSTFFDMLSKCEDVKSLKCRNTLHSVAEFLRSDDLMKMENPRPILDFVKTAVFNIQKEMKGEK